MSGAIEHREVEFKFRIPEDLSVELPSVLVVPDTSVTAQARRQMSATYYDTPNLNLIRWGITLRHRVGGSDDGWHMKIPVEDDSTVRDEIRIDRPDPHVPYELTSIVSPLLRRQELMPVAEVQTDRSPFVLSSTDGEDLLEVVDDRVTVGHAGSSASFREMEVELLDDSGQARRAADTVCAALRSAGAVPSSLSKAVQALGRRAGDPPDVPEVPYPTSQGRAIDALQAIFSRYTRDLLLADVGVRRGAPDSVHRMRVACRRLRASLRTFEPLLDTETVSFLREELSWLATELGQVRDTEVQLESLTSAITHYEVRAFVADGLNQRLRAAHSSAMAAIRSDRHDFLLEDLILLVSEPPVATQAFEEAGTALRECVHTPWRTLRRSIKRTDGSAASWHRVRLRAKQARYAIEAIAPILGEEYSRLGRSLAWVTDTLGSRQDAQVSLHTLEDLASSAPGGIAFELGRLAARFEVTGDQDVRQFQQRWPAILEQARRIGLA